MSIRPAQQRRRGLSMTSLIDVIFLLLLFFMLSSTFTKFSEVQISGTSAGASASQNTPPLFVRLLPDTVQMNGQTLDLETLPTAIAQRRSTHTQTILIAPQADTTTAQRLVDVLVLLAHLPDLNIVVLE